MFILRASICIYYIALEARLAYCDRSSQEPLKFQLESLRVAVSHQIPTGNILQLLSPALSC